MILGISKIWFKYLKWFKMDCGKAQIGYNK